MVVFDTHLLVLAVKLDIGCSTDRAAERVEKLLEDLAANKERIVIPTPALSEFLIYAGAASGEYLTQLQKSSQFRICPFDKRAAIEAAIMTTNAKAKGDKRGGSNSTWPKVKFDRQIIAIGKVEGAHTIYSDDKDLNKFATTIGMAAVSLADLPLPEEPPQKSLPFEPESQEGR